MSRTPAELIARLEAAAARFDQSAAETRCVFDEISGASRSASEERIANNLRNLAEALRGTGRKGKAA